MNENKIIDWLLKGDVSIQYQVYRDLLGADKSEVQCRIEHEGWGKKFLQQRKQSGHWGNSFYQPKWISTHYTLLDLRNLNICPDINKIKESIKSILKGGKAIDGGIRLGPSTALRSDVCVNGMFLNYASYFMTDEISLHSIIDCILGEKMQDGGFNCRTTRSGATHSSVHTTISVLEGFYEFLKSGNIYRKQEIKAAIKSAEEFILMHQLYISDRTGKIIKSAFLKMSYPCRWKYNILRALDYFQYSRSGWDDRMEPALVCILNKRNKDGSWNMQAAYPGKVHFTMERAGKPSRWNTLRVLRILKHFHIDLNPK